MRYPTVTYEREVPAQLFVRLATGEEWEATDADLERFAKPVVEAAYFRFSEGLASALLDNGIDLGHKQDLSNAGLNPIRYLAETTIYFGWKASEHMSATDLGHIAALEDIIRAAFAAQTIEHDIHPDYGKPLLYDNHGEFEHMPLGDRKDHLFRAQCLLDAEPVNDDPADVADESTIDSPK